MNRHLLIFLDKTVFQPIFYFLVLLSRVLSLRGGGRSPELSQLRHILVIRPGGLGDGLMSIPLLRALKKRYPGKKITLICVKKNKAALQHLPYFDKIIVIDDINNIHKNIFVLLKDHFDIVFDLEPFRKMSSIIAYLSGAAIRVGFDTNHRRLLYTHHVTYSNDKCYESVNMIRQLKALGIHVPQDEAIDISFPISDEFRERANTILESYSISSGSDFIIVVVPGVLKKHHRWIMTRFASLIDLILQENEDVKILLMGVPDDIPDAQKVMRHVVKREGIVNLVGKTNFMESLGVLKASKILIASDGGILYMGAAMGCSTISIWGPGVMERFKPPGSHHIGVRKDYFCVPCVNYNRLGEFPKCHYDRKCIKDITAEDVFGQYLRLRKLMANGPNSSNLYELFQIINNCQVSTQYCAEASGIRV